MVSSTTVRKDWKSNSADISLCPQQPLQACMLPGQAAKGLIQLRTTSDRVLCLNFVRQTSTARHKTHASRLGALLLLLRMPLLCQGVRRVCTQRYLGCLRMSFLESNARYVMQRLLRCHNCLLQRRVLEQPL